MFNLACETEAMTAITVQELKARIKWLAVAAAVGGAVPVPGVSALVNIPLLVAEAWFQREQLNIDDDSIHRLVQANKELLKHGQSVLVTGAKELGGVIMTELAVTAALDSGVKVIPVIGQVLGAVTGAAIAASSVYATLTKMLAEHEKIALASLEALGKEEINKSDI